MEEVDLRSTRDYRAGIGLSVIHLMAIGIFFPAFFSWSGVALLVVLWYVTGGIGITLGYHRLLTHRSMKVPALLEYAIATCGALALQGGPIEWVATHRKHHAHSDQDGDPHDTHNGMGWAHIEWLYRTNKDRLHPSEYARWAMDLTKVPYYRFLEKYIAVYQVALALVLFHFGGWSWVFWGVFGRLTFVYHCTWFVNSAAHAVGYKSFRTTDESRNCWWVAVLSFGEGWHNNHHAFPFSARHGLRDHEFDTTWIAIKVLRALKLAKNVKLPTPEMMDRLALRPGEKSSNAA